VPTSARSFVKAFGVGVTNPYQITWWLTVGVTLLTETSLDLLGREFVVGGSEVIAGFFAGILLWITVFPALLVLGRGRRRFDEVVGYTSSFLLILFGAVFVYSALSRVGA
ncbi:MAG: LysE family translocator, partial [Halobacteria archaeon]|nr:LysE family translocator [Halobacteria archaeon]